MLERQVMWCRLCMGQAEDSGEHPCGVCRKGVGRNSIFCEECHRWVHKRCSGISGKLKSNADFHCRRCLEGENGIFQSVLLKEVVIEPNVKLECVPKFCYLGNTLGAGRRGGGSSKGQSEMCFGQSSRELSPILTARGASYRIKGKNIQGVCPECTVIWD